MEDKLPPPGLPPTEEETPRRNTGGPQKTPPGRKKKLLPIRLSAQKKRLLQKKSLHCRFLRICGMAGPRVIFLPFAISKTEPSVLRDPHGRQSPAGSAVKIPPGNRRVSPVFGPDACRKGRDNSGFSLAPASH